MIEQLIGSVRELIDHGSIEEASAGIREAAKLSTEASVPFLYSLFADKPYPLCQAALEGLTCIGKPAFTFLKNIYSTSNDNQKYWIIRTMLKGSREEIEFLAALARKENENICAFLATQLVNVREPRLSVPIILSLFKKSSWLVKKNCAQSLTEIGRPVVPYLKKLFGLKNRDLKFWVIRVLAEILKDDLYPFLEKMLAESPGAMGYYALIGLDKIDSPRSCKLLVDTLGSSRWMLRAEALEILRRKGKTVLPYLKKSFNTSNPEQRYLIIRLIGEISGNKALPFLKEILSRHSIELRYSAVSALGRIPT
ncbi:MAG: HEAT repeat domain-containing protein, partial [Candidatus Wallbacteria bacterium]|nr:HEAT repeat domain-containing protein [Candidatus Wallbacteria bacterium]